MAHFTPDSVAAPTVLTVPGLNSSGPSHWQSLWEASRPDTVRAELGMWTCPHRNSWVTKLDQAIRTARAPVILVAHSLGCQAVAWWAELSGQPYGWPVAGALLVAPADVDRRDAPAELSGFAPTPAGALPFPSILVASRDDPWIEIGRARSLAGKWGSHFVDVGTLGHINAASGIGDWIEGQALLHRLIDATAGDVPPTQAAVRAVLTTALAEERLAPGL
jgi:predicted alpha/beta hydrolase family esterase